MFGVSGRSAEYCECGATDLKRPEPGAHVDSIHFSGRTSSGGRGFDVVPGPRAAPGRHGLGVLAVCAGVAGDGSSDRVDRDRSRDVVAGWRLGER